MLLITTANIFAQEDHNWFISVTQDPKMAVEGAHGEGGVLNPEISLGIDWEHVRVSVKYEWLKQINYEKWTVLAFDYKVVNFYNLTLLAGIEGNIIVREHINAHYNKLNNYRNKTYNLSLGANLEANYYITDNIALVLNTNWFSAEEYDNYGNDMKPLRWDVRAGMMYKFN